MPKILLFTPEEQAEARRKLARMKVRSKAEGALTVASFLAEAITHALTVPADAGPSWLRRAAAVYAGWEALPLFAPEPVPRVDELAQLPSAAPATYPVESTAHAELDADQDAAMWRHLDVIDALAGDHDARAEVAL